MIPEILTLGSFCFGKPDDTNNFEEPISKYNNFMPQHKSAIKRVRQNEKRRKHNRTQRSRMNTLINNVLEATDKDEAQAHLKKAMSYLDRVASKGLIHPNNAARKKSKLTKHVNNL